MHAFRGKEFVEYDNPYDVGMTGLIGFSSGYRAMEHCDALLMLGTDFPYRPFFPEGVPVVQVDVRGERMAAGSRSRCPWSARSAAPPRACCRCCGPGPTRPTWTG